MSVLPVKRDLALATSLLVAVLVCAVSAAGLLIGTDRLYGGDPKVALGVAASAAGIVVPGFRAHDALNLVFGLPILLATVWLARRGSRMALLLWPGALFYVLYTYAQYLVGAPFGPLFLAYVALVVLSAYTVIGVVAGVDGEQVRRQLDGVVPARTVGGILVGLGLLTLAQDAGGALATAFAAGATADSIARHVWIADLTLEVPAMLVGGVLLWRRAALGYVVGAGLLLQYGMTPVVLAAIIALQPLLTNSPIDVGTVIALLVFAAISYVPLALIARGAVGSRPAESAGVAESMYADGEALRRRPS